MVTRGGLWPGGMSAINDATCVLLSTARQDDAGGCHVTHHDVTLFGRDVTLFGRDSW